MNLALAPGYLSRYTKYLVVHHCGAPSATPNKSAAYLTAEDIDAEHKVRFAFKSALGHYGGYNFYIDRTGLITQFRQIGEETTAQYGYNFNGVAISVCLAGNFSKGSPDRPSPGQIAGLQLLRAQIANAGITIADYNIIPHRGVGMTECYGSALSEDWARVASRPTTIPVIPTPTAEVVALKEKLSLLQQLVVLYSQLVSLTRKLGFGAPLKISEPIRTIQDNG